jgi:hypothetical protein
VKRRVYTEDERTCYRYVVMYRCAEGDQERVAEISMENDYEYGYTYTASVVGN